MRFRVDVAAGHARMEWPDVHGPARAVVHDLIRSQDAELAAELHSHGWGGTPPRPLGVSPPVFTGTRRTKGAYMTSDTGSLWLGSPIPQIALCMLAGLAGRHELHWGRVPLRVKGVQLEHGPDHSSGRAEFASVSPVLVKHHDLYLLPDDPQYGKRLAHNLRHKAEILDLPRDVEVEIVEAGPRRRFEVQGALRIGATVRLRVVAAPALLDACHQGGIGLATNQGFGWLR
ncbi:CRISPR-associated endoribonuclease Cas6 [Sinosporangium album]|uniref:CRISPR-associated endoribonuclease Cas6 n=1 Tax=Sinosporangium album TaxID=504805 RepID=A0A1G7V0Q1_9ACTN|nr:CRISPR-associated endoribonuclease Cas6 [Sinosporangium album]SDG52540.1 CRISPR-associated endoribonuclease Cas6 [Sinosporangium album]